VRLYCSILWRFFLISASIFGKKSKLTIKKLIRQRDKYQWPMRVRIKHAAARCGSITSSNSAISVKMCMKSSSDESDDAEWCSMRQLHETGCYCDLVNRPVPSELLLEEIRDGQQFLKAIMLNEGRVSLSAIYIYIYIYEQ